jgi:two-component SAPR family response regulator
MKVVLIDDDAEDLMLNQKLLDKMNVDVVTFEGTEQAIEFLKQNNDIDFIFVDMLMPILSGIDFAKFIRQAMDVRAKIYFLSGWERFLIKDTDIEKLVDGYIQKPLTLEKLQSPLESLEVAS